MPRTAADTHLRNAGQYRVSLRLSIVEIARISNLNRSTITKIEAGRPVDSISVLKLLDALAAEARKFNQTEILRQLELNAASIEKKQSPSTYALKEEMLSHHAADAGKNVYHVIALLKELFHSGNLVLCKEEDLFYLKDSLEEFADLARTIKYRNQIK